MTNIMIAKWSIARSSGVVYTCRVGHFSMSVTNCHIEYPGMWIGNCSPLVFTDMVLDAEYSDHDPRDAQEELMTKVLIYFKQLTVVLETMKVKK